MNREAALSVDGDAIDGQGNDFGERLRFELAIRFDRCSHAHSWNRLRAMQLLSGVGEPAFDMTTKALNGLPLIIRTLDIGGDKVVPYLSFPKEDNPFLGVRGIRLCLRHPELFVPQLRAIYRAAQTGPVKMMFPI